MNQLPVACFAPQLTDEILKRYKDLTTACKDAAVRDAMAELVACVERWWSLPTSARTAVTPFTLNHKGKDVVLDVTPLEEDHVKLLDPVTPWMKDLLVMEVLIDALPGDAVETSPGSGVVDEAKKNTPAWELKRAAKHLLWFAKEITLDREPVTADKLKV